MTLRTKLVIALGLLSVAATLTLGTLTYRTTETNLRSQVNSSLDDYGDRLAADVNHLGPRSSPRALLGLFAIYGGYDAGRPVPKSVPASGTNPDIDGDGTVGPTPPGRPRRPDELLLQLTDSAGKVVAATSPGSVPVVGSSETSGHLPPGRHDFREIEVDGERFRLLSIGTPGGITVQVARSVAETQHVLSSLRRRTILIGALVSLVAAGLGWLVARRITKRLTRLTVAAEDVARTGRLDVEVPVTGADEAGRLGVAFSDMLNALARSRDDQQRLVQDAGHELRTPLTSLRTNIATLRRHDRIDPEVRGRLMQDLDSEAKELTDLVNELVELATDSRADELTETVDLGEVSKQIAVRAARRSNRTITVTSDGSQVEGQRTSLERAISNLVDNAVKFTVDPDAQVEVAIHAGRVEVNDRGPGIPEADLPRIFDRFHRAVTARSHPGSGLGLSIVHDVAIRHGGTVFAANRVGGGASIGFVVPGAFQPDSYPNRPRGQSDSNRLSSGKLEETVG